MDPTTWETTIRPPEDLLDRPYTIFAVRGNTIIRLGAVSATDLAADIQAAQREGRVVDLEEART